MQAHGVELCKRGHKLTEENNYWGLKDIGKGRVGRQCYLCHREKMKLWMRQRRLDLKNGIKQRAAPRIKKVKYCPRCKQDKTVDRFYHNKTSFDMLNAYCMECSRENTAVHQRSDAGKAMLKEHGTKMYAKYKVKHRARLAVMNAVKDGTLVKPANCSSCDRTGLKLEGHHPDYSKPLEVEWLCNICHKSRHGRIQDANLLPVAPPQEAQE